MINIKKIILIIIISSISFTGSYSAIKDSLFATIGDKAITKSDIYNEIKIILILSGKIFSEDQRKQIERAAIQELIRRNIKLIEIERLNFAKFNKDDLNKELYYMAQSINMDLDTLKNTFIANDIDFSNIVNHVKIELIWNSMIYEIYQNRLFINLDEIEEQLKSFKNKKKITEYLVSEIIIKPVPKDQQKTEIERIKNKINIEGFEKVAMSLSISETAIRGGDLGWLSENIISDEFKFEVINTKIGDVSEPIILPEGILFFKLRDKRSMKELLNIEDAKGQLINTERIKILKMHSLSHYDKLRRIISVNYK